MEWWESGGEDGVLVGLQGWGEGCDGRDEMR